MPADAAPSPLRGSAGAMHFLARQPRRRRADDALGQPLYLLRAGLVVVPVARRGTSWECMAILAGRSSGAVERVVASDIEVETALSVVILPTYDVDEPFDHVTVWLTRVWQRWPGGHHPRLAQVLAEAADPFSLTLELTEDTVRVLVERVHLRPTALRRMLAQMETAGLLTRLDDVATGRPWGRYALVVPA